MRTPAGVLILLSLATPVAAQYVPPVPKAVEGHTRLRNTPIPVPEAGQRWIRAKSPNFTVISSASERRTREIANLLETVSSALRHVHPRFDAKFTDTTVFVFGKRRDSQPFFDLLLNQKRTGASGVFVAQPDGSGAIIVDAARPLATDKTVKHELMHNILAASGARLPLWLEEGIAEYFSTTQVRGDQVIVGRPIFQHQVQLRSRALPAEEVLSAKSGSPVVNHVLFYPQVWAMVDWMMRSGRDRFYGFVSDIERGVDQDVAFRTRFDLDPAAVSRMFRNLSMRPAASAAMEIETRPVVITMSQITAADALAEIASFLCLMHRTRDDAEQYLNAALELDAQHARAVAGLATVRSYQRRYDDAASLFEKALALNDTDPSVKLAYASSLLRNALGPLAGAIDLEGDAAARFRRARELAQSAVATEPSALADAVAGTTYLVEDDAAPGIALLERARDTRPGRIDFAINLYALYLRSGNRDLADALFAQAFERSRNPQAAFAARAVFVREALRKANALVREDRIDEAALVIRDLASVTPDQSAREELLRQAADLERTADSNRQIIEYNKAVVAFNQRDYSSALRILDELVAAATDLEVRNRAEKLRNTVRKRLGGM